MWKEWTHEKMEQVVPLCASVDALLRELASMGDQQIEGSRRARDMTNINTQPRDVAKECRDSAKR